MLRTLAIAAALAMTGGAAFAAGERASDCQPIARFKAEVSKNMPGARFTAMSVGQYHFVQGLYVGLPSTAEGLPPGDGALLSESESGSGIAFTRGGNLVCMFKTRAGGEAPGIPITPGLVAVIKAVRTGKLEEAPISSPVEEPKAEDSADCIKRNPDACSF
jgi:hypothetical protein